MIIMSNLDGRNSPPESYILWVGIMRYILFGAIVPRGMIAIDGQRLAATEPGWALPNQPEFQGDGLIINRGSLA